MFLSTLLLPDRFRAEFLRDDLMKVDSIGVFYLILLPLSAYELKNHVFNFIF